MMYDRIVRVLGPFEIREYFGIALVLGSLAVTAPFAAVPQAVRATR